MRKTEDFVAYIDDYQMIVVYLNNNYYDGNSNYFNLSTKGGSALSCTIIEKQSSRDYIKYVLQLAEVIIIGEIYELCDSHDKKIAVEYGIITKTTRFDQENSYLGDDLGVSYSRKQSTFALWSPTSHSVRLLLVKGRRRQEFMMARSERGVFRLALAGNWGGYRYCYYLEMPKAQVKVVDPYAKSLSANTEYGVVINPAKIKQDLGKAIELGPYVDQIIYEISVRDMTSAPSANVRFPRKYLGLAESKTKYHNYSTALDYIASLGVTMLQVLPVTDFGSVDELNLDAGYNWGYDPVHFMALEGGYSRKPQDGYSRIVEFKKMIKAFHNHNLAVSLDLVYNHVYQVENSAFNKLVPNYYFLMNEEGELSNGSYCGNDYDSAKIMARKYLIDSCLNWVREYDIDAFRFDLMGIIDNETMNQIVERMREIKPHFIVYGEGWDMPAMLESSQKTTINNHQQTPQIAFFSDRFRDVVKGSSHHNEERTPGYGSYNVNLIEDMKNVMAASVLDYGWGPYVAEPHQMINYVECHDNLTLWDKLSYCCESEGEKERLARVKLMNACVLLAQGVPFIHAGQEFARTKMLDHNSYRSSDEINKIDYQRMIQYHSVVNYTKDLIRLRKDYPQFRLLDKASIARQVSFENLDHGCLLYRIVNEEGQLDCFINPTYETIDYEYDKAVLILANEAGYLDREFRQRIITVNPLTVVVIKYGK